MLSISDSLQTCNRGGDFLCLFWVVGGPGVLHPRALLPDVHVRRRVGHTWPKYPVALLPSVEVRCRGRCLVQLLLVWRTGEPSLSSLLQVFPPAGRRVGSHVRSRQRDERRHSQLLPEGVLVQAGLLSALFLLLSLQVGLKPPCSKHLSFLTLHASWATLEICWILVTHLYGQQPELCIC